MAPRKLKPGDLYEGPKYVATIDGVTSHWADTKTGPVRLVHVDLAPDDPDDGREEYRIASDDDPVQEVGSYVDLEVDEIQGQTSTEA
jgi:hypothetical protein